MLSVVGVGEVGGSKVQIKIHAHKISPPLLQELTEMNKNHTLNTLESINYGEEQYGSGREKKMNKRTNPEKGLL